MWFIRGRNQVFVNKWAYFLNQRKKQQMKIYFYYRLGLGYLKKKHEALGRYSWSVNDLKNYYFIDKKQCVTNRINCVYFKSQR